MRRSLSSGIAGIVGLAILLIMSCGLASAQESTAPRVDDQPAQVRQFLDLLATPAVQEWLRQAQAAPAPPAVAAPPQNQSMSAGFAERIVTTRAHVREIVQALPYLPDRIAEAGGRLSRALSNDEGVQGGTLVAMAFALGAAGVFAMRRWGRGATREWQQAHREPVGRLKRLALRLLIAALPALGFAAGVLIALMLFAWPLVLKSIVIAYALAVISILLADRWLRVLLVNPVPVPQPASEASSGGAAEADSAAEAEAEAAAIPTPASAIQADDPRKVVFWHRRIVLFIGYFFLSTATLETLRVLDVARPSVQAFAYLLGLGYLAIGLEAVWRRPQAQAEGQKQLGAQAASILLTLLGVVLWWLWAAGLNGLFWLLTFAVVLPVAIRTIDWRVMRLLRPEGGGDAGHASVLEVCITRGLRLVLVIGAVYWLSEVWHTDLIALTSDTTPLKRLVRGVLNAVVTLFFADFVWQLLKAAIDARLMRAGSPGSHGAGAPAAGEGGIGHGDDPVRQARLRTLLPIFRNILFVVIAGIAILMSLSGLGVEIAPLIAGAGVVGVAVGFGSQTLVKDVISGVFYLLDDAFRVGEYIQSGNYKGQVESFSLRSVKLRHHRGPIFTVPFGLLGAVQNMSRDWVMDKFTFNVAFDTDLEKARKIIKSIGQQLAEEPEHAANILEPLKMQGVEQFGEYGMQIKCKMMTRPGEQFLIRRLALRRIKQAFDEAGIRFALPQVHVAGNGDAAAVAAAGQIRSVLAAEGRKEE